MLQSVEKQCGFRVRNLIEVIRLGCSKINVIQCSLHISLSCWSQLASVPDIVEYQMNSSIEAQTES